MLMRYWASATDSPEPVMVMVRSVLLSRSSQFEMRIMAPLICLSIVVCFSFNCLRLEIEIGHAFPFCLGPVFFFLPTSCQFWPLDGDTVVEPSTSQQFVDPDSKKKLGKMRQN